MLRPTRPSDIEVRRYRERVSSLSPTYPASGEFHSFQHVATVGDGQESFIAGKAALNEWEMHAGAGVCVDPAPLKTGQTVVLWTRTLGIWILFACRITQVIDEPGRFGFTYATLPDHPEQGEETFMLELEGDTVELTVSARSRPGTKIARLTAPVGKVLQQRYTDRYLAAMKAYITTNE